MIITPKPWKKLLGFFIIYLCSMPLSFGLSEIDGSKTLSYKMVIESPLYWCDIIGRKLSDSIYIGPANTIFTVVGTKTDSSIIRFWIWDDDHPEKIANFNYTDTSRTIRRYFIISNIYLSSNAIPRYSMIPSLTANAITVPLKLRFDPFDFSPLFSLGYSLGVKFRLSPYTNSNFFTASIGLKIGTVTLDSLTTGFSVPTQYNTPSAISPVVGGVLEVSGVQVGLYLGLDFISNNKDIAWVYQGKPWISIGLGYPILTKESISNNERVEGLNSE